MSFTGEEMDYINTQHLARIATVASDGQPDVTAVVFEFDGTNFYIGGFNASATRRAHNVRDGNDKIALVIDDLKTIDPWTPRFLRIYGTGELVDRDGQQALKITPVTSWSMNLSGDWSPGSDVENVARKAHHTSNSTPVSE